jgi:hypothetical protein
MTVFFANTSNFFAKLNSCTGNDTVYLFPGNYGDLSYWWDAGNPARTANDLFSSQVIVQSVNPNDPATFNGLVVSGVRNITFKNIKFWYDAQPAEAWYTRQFEVLHADNIVFRNSEFAGGNGVDQPDYTANGYGVGYGLYSTNTRNLTIEYCTSNSWGFGFIITGCRDVNLMNCNCFNMSSDAVQFSAVDGIRASHNYIHDFRIHPESSAHPDGIQLHNNSVEYPCSNVIIEYNIIDQRGGDWTQSIFMGNEAVDAQGFGANMWYQNITVQNNLVINGHLHGITLGTANGVFISNNTVIRSLTADPSGSALWSPTITIAANSTNVVIVDNITSINLAAKAASSATNCIVRQYENVAAPNYYASLVSGAYDMTARNDLGAGTFNMSEPVFPTYNVAAWTLTTS